jgi:aminotransferase
VRGLGAAGRLRDRAGRSGPGRSSCDFAYADLEFDGRRPASFLAEPGARRSARYPPCRTYGIAGWRLGFVVSGDGSACWETCAPASSADPGGGSRRSPNRRSRSRSAADHERRRDQIVARPARADSTFYVWWPLPEGLTPERILAEQRIAVAPGEGFGAQGQGWARISLATPDERLDAGLERLARAL